MPRISSLPRAILPLMFAALATTAASSAAASDNAPDVAPGMVPVAEAGSAGLFTFTCDNGMPVVIDTRPGTRTVFVEIGVRVGSRDEPEGLAGMSHLLEHLLFKEGHGAGSRPNPAFSALRSAGALVNASTDFELTEYHADLPAESFSEGWDALVSMVTRTAFDRTDVERERDVVLQEAALGKVDPVAIVAYSVLGKVFSDDPIAQPVIGFRRTLKRITFEDLEAHYRHFYTAPNMFALVVGDVTPAEAAASVHRTLGRMSAEGRTHAPYPTPTASLQPLYRFRTLVKQSYLLAGSLTKGESSPDAMSLELLSTVLGDGRTSRLHRRLVAAEALTDEVLAIAFQVSTTGALAAGLAVDPRRAEEARMALVEELRRLAREPVAPGELDTARTLMRGRLIRQFETNEGIAGFRARRMLLHQPIGRDEFLARADRLEPDDLLRVARAHWGEEAAAPRAAGGAAGLIEIQILPARAFGKVIAALKFIIFRRL